MPATRPAFPSAGTAPPLCPLGSWPRADRPATWPRRPRARAIPARPERWAEEARAPAISCTFSFALGAAEKLRELLGRHRLAVQEALYLVAAVALEEVELPIGLGALRDHLERERVPERDDGGGEDAVLALRARADGAHERAVDLQRIDRQVLQVREARGGGAGGGPPRAGAPRV